MCVCFQCECLCWCVLFVPVHSWPQSLLPLQHLQDELPPLLFQVIGVKALRKLNTTKFYPHLETSAHTNTHKKKKEQTFNIPSCLSATAHLIKDCD